MMIIHIFLCSVSIFFFKQKTAYEMRISDWSSDVCSSDLNPTPRLKILRKEAESSYPTEAPTSSADRVSVSNICLASSIRNACTYSNGAKPVAALKRREKVRAFRPARSEEHTSELQSLMRISYAVFCLKKKTNTEKMTKMNRHIRQ